MNEVVTENVRRPIVSVHDGAVFADSRDVAAFFEKAHYDVLRDIRNLIAKEPSLGLRNFEAFKINDLTGESTGHYDMDRDGFTLLAMGFTGGKALGWKLKYIEAFNTMEAELRAPRDPMKVLNDPAALRGLLANYSEKVLALEAEKAAMKPDVEALERIAKADGSLCLTDAAKTLQVRRTDLIRMLVHEGWIYRRLGGTPWLGYQTKVSAGLLEHKTAMIMQADGTERITEQVRVTPKGLTKLAAMLAAAGRLAA